MDIGILVDVGSDTAPRLTHVLGSMKVVQLAVNVGVVIQTGMLMVEEIVMG